MTPAQPAGTGRAPSAKIPITGAEREPEPIALKAYTLMLALLAWCLLAVVGPVLSMAASVAASTAPAGHDYDAVHHEYDPVVAMADVLDSKGEDRVHHQYDTVQHLCIGIGEPGGEPSSSIAARGVASFPTKPGQLGHIFRNAPGHLADTPANRNLLIDVASDATNRVGVDRFGNVWSSVTRADGTQVVTVG